MKIYTKTGDQGKTALVNGSRVSKDDLRIEVYGTFDEVNSFVGWLKSFLKKSHGSYARLTAGQEMLFTLGSLYACPAKDRDRLQLQCQKLPELIAALEKDIDSMQEKLPPLKNFILPGGCQEASIAHVIRTTVRRGERLLVAFEKENPDESVAGAIIFLNRLSDYFFVLARLFNIESKTAEVLWKS